MSLWLSYHLWISPLDITNLNLTVHGCTHSANNSMHNIMCIVMFYIGETHHFTTSTTTLLIDSLHPFTNYIFYVWAYNTGGESSQVHQNFTTMESGTHDNYVVEENASNFSCAVPSGIPNVSLCRLGSRSFDLMWFELPHSQRNGIINYTIEVIETEPLGVRLMYNYSTSSTSFTVPRLHPHRQYTYRVAASTSAGVGNFTAPTTIRTNEEGKNTFD